MALKFHSGDSSLSVEEVQIRTVSMPNRVDKLRPEVKTRDE
jgi:hypothetical protein